MTAEATHAAALGLSEADVRRFWSHVEKTQTCWLWTGALKPSGYGNFHIGLGDGGRLVPPAHRVSYLLAGKSIEPAEVVDHICRVRHCVNPDHLRAVTNQENVLAGIGPTAINARKTHCKRGHEFTQENTIATATGRECRACKTLRNKARWQAKLEERGYPSLRSNHETCKKGLHPWPESRILRGQKWRCHPCEQEGWRVSRLKRKARALALADLAASHGEGSAG